MNRRRSVLVVWLLVPLFLFMSAEEGHGGSAAKDFLGKVVNFLVLFGGLTFVLYKPVRAMLGKRRDAIREDLGESKSRRENAEKRYGESAARLAGLGTEIGKMQTDADGAARRESDRIARTGAAEAEKIRRFVELEIDEQARGALRELKAYAADKATAAARERIRRRLSEADQSALIDKSIEKLSRLHERPGSR